MQEKESGRIKIQHTPGTELKNNVLEFMAETWKIKSGPRVRVADAVRLTAKKEKCYAAGAFALDLKLRAPDCYDFDVAKEVKPWHRNYYKDFWSMPLVVKSEWNFGPAIEHAHVRCWIFLDNWTRRLCL